MKTAILACSTAILALTLSSCDCNCNKHLQGPPAPVMTKPVVN